MQRGTKDFETLKTRIFAAIITMNRESNGGANLSAVHNAIRQDSETFHFSDIEFINVLNCLIKDGLINVIKVENLSKATIRRTRFDFFVDPIIVIART